MNKPNLEKQWQSFSEKCVHCGGDTEIFTVGKLPNEFYEDDPIHCKDCKGSGIMAVGSCDINDVWIEWDGEI